jgi:hypothetical protein
MTVAEALTYRGQCHCGAIRVALVLSKPAEETEVRACQCGFCTRHGGMTVSDANGRAVFEIDPQQLANYQFATGSGTVLLCRVCGVYAGMILEAGDKVFSVVNVRGLAIPEFADANARPVVYDQETREQRIARRKQMWTPTEVQVRRA